MDATAGLDRRARPSVPAPNRLPQLSDDGRRGRHRIQDDRHRVGRAARLMGGRSRHPRAPALDSAQSAAVARPSGCRVAQARALLTDSAVDIGRVKAAASSVGAMVCATHAAITPPFSDSAEHGWIPVFGGVFLPGIEGSAQSVICTIRVLPRQRRTPSSPIRGRPARASPASGPPGSTSRPAQPPTLPTSHPTLRSSSATRSSSVGGSGSGNTSSTSVTRVRT